MAQHRSGRRLLGLETIARTLERRRALVHPPSLVSRRRPSWADHSQSELLRLRLCDLDLSLESSWLKLEIDLLMRRIADRALLLKPDFYLSDEWMTPDDCLGIGVPFYLMHPKLMHLERTFMLEVEGGTRPWAQRLLRHEAGHVVCNAYRLHRRPGWRQVFGSPSVPYPKQYRPDPTSKDYVVHLDGWYAQCHPDEDWAETFAVWLSPRAHWRRRYAGWPALAKLEYVDQLMAELEGAAPELVPRRRPYSLPQLKLTLGDYYRRKQMRYGIEFPQNLDPRLERIFTRDRRVGVAATSFLRQNRQSILRHARHCGHRRTREIESWSTERAFDSLLLRCRELELRCVGRPRRTLAACASLVALCARCGQLEPGVVAV